MHPSSSYPPSSGPMVPYPHMYGAPYDADPRLTPLQGIAAPDGHSYVLPRPEYRFSAPIEWHNTVLTPASAPGPHHPPVSAGLMSSFPTFPGFHPQFPSYAFQPPGFQYEYASYPLYSSGVVAQPSYTLMPPLEVAHRPHPPLNDPACGYLATAPGPRPVFTLSKGAYVSNAVGPPSYARAAGATAGILPLSLSAPGFESAGPAKPARDRKPPRTQLFINERAEDGSADAADMSRKTRWKRAIPEPDLTPAPCHAPSAAISPHTEADDDTDDGTGKRRRKSTRKVCVVVGVVHVFMLAG